MLLSISGASVRPHSVWDSASDSCHGEKVFSDKRKGQSDSKTSDLFPAWWAGVLTMQCSELHKLADRQTDGFTDRKVLTLSDGDPSLREHHHSVLLQTHDD